MTGEIAGSPHIRLLNPQQIADEKNRDPMPLLGYDDSLRAGAAVCYAVAKKMLQQRGILLFGSPGTAKGKYAFELAFLFNTVSQSHKESLPQFYFAEINGTGLASQYSSPDDIRKRLASACKNMVHKSDRPVLLHIDEIDALTPRRETNADHLTLVQWMMGFLDTLPDMCVNISVTNCPDLVDSAVRKRIPHSLFVPFTTKEIICDLLGRLNVQPATDVADLMCDGAELDLSRYSGNVVCKAVQDLENVEPQGLKGTPDKIAQAIRASCLPTPIREIDKYYDDYPQLVDQSERFLNQWTKRYHEWLG